MYQPAVEPQSTNRGCLPEGHEYRNPDKTQVTASHLRNKEAKRSLKIQWYNSDLKNTDYPKYLGITLDMTLDYKEHIHNTKMKVATRNNLPRKLATPNGEQMQVQSEQRHWLYATRSPKMQRQYGRYQNIHTYWTLSSTKHAWRSQDS